MINILGDSKKLKEQTLEAVDKGIEKAEKQGNDEQLEVLQECRDLIEDGQKGKAVRKLLTSDEFDIEAIEDAL